MQSILSAASENLKLVSFVAIPIQAFCAHYLFFRKSGYRFIELTILPFYTQGHIYWLSIASLFLYYSIGDFLPAWLIVVVSITYICYGYSNMFTYQSKWKSFAKGFVIYITTQVFVSILFTIGLIILILLDPEVFNMIRPSNNR